MSHLSTRQFQALVLCKLEETRAEVKNLRELFVDRFSAVLLSPKLTPIPRPVQGKEIKRSSNVTKILREEIERRNSKKMELGRHSEETPEPLYLQFDAEVNDTRLNSEAMKSIETIMRLRLDEGWDTKRWNEICSTDRQKSELVIQEAAR